MKLGTEKIRAKEFFLIVLVSCPLASSSSAKPTILEGRKHSGIQV